MYLSELEQHSLGDINGLSQTIAEDEPRQINVRHRGSLARQLHENDIAELVLVSEPEGASITMGGLHPVASLYERPVNLEESKKQHAAFRNKLRSYGVQGDAEPPQTVPKTINERVALEDLAMHALEYKLNPVFAVDQLSEKEKQFLSDDYKRTVIEQMPLAQLIDVLMINPTVELTPTRRDTGFEAKYEYQPLSNLIYTRDQQITTAKGIVMGNLQSKQREKEVRLLKFCFEKLGLKVSGYIEDPGYLEGGDFFPAGDICFIGIGLRSNYDACHQLMRNDWLGTKHVAVVKDLFDQSQDRMHLDCVFNILGHDCCLMLEDIMGEKSDMKRLVDEYVWNQSTMSYEIKRTDCEFSVFVKEMGFSIIPISRKDQLRYACNVLNLGNGQIISVDRASSRCIVKDQNFKGNVEVVEFSSITSMYGAVHCSTQVIRRSSSKNYPMNRTSSLLNGLNLN